MKTRSKWVRVLCLGLVALMWPGLVLACPLCNEGIQEDPSLPMAYQASILFMLAMPFTVLGGLAGLIVYKFRQHARMVPAVIMPGSAVNPPAESPAERGLRV